MESRSQSESIDYFDGNQKLIGEFIYPAHAENKVLPTVIVFHAFEGRSQFAVGYAKKLAAEGYIAFVADMYGDAKVSNTIDGCFELITPFLQDRALVRKRALLAFDLVSKNSRVDKNKISAVGFCFGGMCVLEIARSGANLHAGIGLHAVFLKSGLPTAPIKSKLLLLHGYKDPQVPPEKLSNFADEMIDAKVKDWTFVYFGHAQHSFTDPKTGTFDSKKEAEMGRAYDPVAAERSFKYVLEFLREI